MNWLAAAVIGTGVLAVTSRRWSGPLLASALGMGLFIGVALGPSIDRVGALGSQVITLEGESSPPVEPTLADGGSTANGAGAGGGTPATVNSTPAPLSTAPLPATTPAPVDPVGDDGDQGADDPGPGPDPDPDPDPQTLSGTVVHVNPVAESYALSVRGELYGIHARTLPDPGDRLEVAIRELANGTYAEDGKRAADGTTESATLNGFVTYADQDGREPAYTVSVRGVSVLVTLPSGGSGDKLPELGEFVSVEVDIAKPEEEAASRLRKAAKPRDAFDAVTAATGGCVREEPVEPVEPREELIEQSIEPTGDAFTYFDLAGMVQAVCPESRELLISADGIRRGGVDLTLTVPEGIDLERLELDQPVLATAELGDDGDLSLAGVASDDGADGADDAKQLQGDLAGG